MVAKARKEVVAALREGTARVLCATGQLIGKGFDCPALSALFVATPIKFDGRVCQYLGRVLRPAPGKLAAQVFDYEDKHIGVLVNAVRTRRRVYEKWPESPSIEDICGIAGLSWSTPFRYVKNPRGYCR